MEFQVNTNQVILRQQDQVESGEYNVTECNFTFSSEFDGLTKKAVFTGEDDTAYLQTIVDNKCSIPSEILEVSQVVEIGVYAYDVENEELVLRYSPEPTEFFIHQGSYKEAQNSTPPTPTEIEQLQSQITSNKNDIEEIQGNIVEINQTLGTIATDIEEITGDISDIKAEQITQNENIQKNTDDITDINNSIGTINSNINDIQGDISDIKAEQITQNGDIQTNANDISDIKGEQLTQNQNIQTNAQNISNETLNRQQADNNLQNQIDAITVSSDVIDVLGTYQDLQNYDTSHVKANDIIKVLQDSTHNDSMSYYRWVIVDHVGSWQYVGSEGPYYTKAETDTLLNTKANSSDVYTKSETDTLLNEKANQTSLDTTNQNVTNLTGRVSTNEEDIADIKEEQTTQNADIEELQNQVETLQEDLDNANSEIEELNTDITNMRKAMYKVDGQGSDITLQNTSENKFVEFGLEGRTEQEQLSGKNLAYISSFWKRTGSTLTIDLLSQELTANGSVSDAGNFIAYLNDGGIILKANKTYILSVIMDGNVSGNAYRVIYANGGVTVGDITSNTTRTHTYTPTEDTNITLLNFDLSAGTTFSNFKIKVQVEESSTATSYEPYCRTEYLAQIHNFHRVLKR